MTKEEFLGKVGLFVWSFGSDFLIQIDSDFYVWSDPDYSGDGTIKKYDGDYKKWCEENGISFGREKGYHKISEYCGKEVKFI